MPPSANAVVETMAEIAVSERVAIAVFIRAAPVGSFRQAPNVLDAIGLIAGQRALT
jgi:hypothetical protein